MGRKDYTARYYLYKVLDLWVSFSLVQFGEGMSANCLPEMSSRWHGNIREENLSDASKTLLALGGCPITRDG